MADLSQLKGAQELVRKLRAKAASATKDTNVDVVVGFTQNYAIWVHENLEAIHLTGQAKFLEQPLRQNREKYLGIIKQAVRQGKTLAQGLLLAGLALQRDAQMLCPVDTGALKASAFTRLEQR